MTFNQIGLLLVRGFGLSLIGVGSYYLYSALLENLSNNEERNASAYIFSVGLVILMLGSSFCIEHFFSHDFARPGLGKSLLQVLVIVFYGGMLYVCLGMSFSYWANDRQEGGEDINRLEDARLEYERRFFDALNPLDQQRTARAVELIDSNPVIAAYIEDMESIHAASENVDIDKELRSNLAATIAAELATAEESEAKIKTEGLLPAQDRVLTLNAELSRKREAHKKLLAFSSAKPQSVDVEVLLPSELKAALSEALDLEKIKQKGNVPVEDPEKAVEAVRGAVEYIKAVISLLPADRHVKLEMPIVVTLDRGRKVDEVSLDALIPCKSTRTIGRGTCGNAIEAAISGVDNAEKSVPAAIAHLDIVVDDLNAQLTQEENAVAQAQQDLDDVREKITELRGASPEEQELGDSALVGRISSFREVPDAASYNRLKDACGIYLKALRGREALSGLSCENSAVLAVAQKYDTFVQRIDTARRMCSIQLAEKIKSAQRDAAVDMVGVKGKERHKVIGAAVNRMSAAADDCIAAMPPALTQTIEEFRNVRGELAQKFNPTKTVTESGFAELNSILSGTAVTRSYMPAFQSLLQESWILFGMIILGQSGAFLPLFPRKPFVVVRQSQKSTHDPLREAARTLMELLQHDLGKPYLGPGAIIASRKMADRCREAEDLLSQLIIRGLVKPVRAGEYLRYRIHARGMEVLRDFAMEPAQQAEVALKHSTELRDASPLPQPTPALETAALAPQSSARSPHAAAQTAAADDRVAGTAGPRAASLGAKPMADAGRHEAVQTFATQGRQVETSRGIKHAELAGSTESRANVLAPQLEGRERPRTRRIPRKAR
jgi:uncharacterized coiled-coil protein SlyX